MTLESRSRPLLFDNRTRLLHTHLQVMTSGGTASRHGGSFQKHHRVRPRAVAFVVARLSSTRLAAKNLRLIGGRPVLDWILEELKRCRRLDETVVATVAERANEPLLDFCRDRGVECFWYEGEVDHVTTRLRRAAERYDAEICILVSGDCPVTDASSIDEIVGVLERDPAADTVQLAGQDEPPALQGVVGSRLAAWQLADDLADRPELREHQFPLLWQRPDLFRSVALKLPPHLCMPFHRLSVDTSADLEFLETVWKLLEAQGKNFALAEVVALLKGRPELRAINAHVCQRSVAEQVRRVLFEVDAGGSFGFGHLARSLEIASQIVERLSWPVCFVIDHRDAEEMLRKRGFRSLWGAFAREPRSGGPEIERFNSDYAPYDLVVLDIFDQRGPIPGWRERESVSPPVVVVESLVGWAAEADLVIVPSVLGYGAQSPAARATRIVEGPDCLILRREVARLVGSRRERDIDLLAYLHDEDRRRELEDWGRRNGSRVVLPDRFSEEFPELLSRSRVYLSGFGISFYEALALRAVPVCWPDSEAHRKDALRFYEWLNVSPLIVESISDLDRVDEQARRLEAEELPLVEDRTPALVELVRALVDRVR